MPRNENPVVPIERLTPEERTKEPGNSQEHYYILAGTYSQDLSVLDVGAGTGSGLTVLRAMGAKNVFGIDLLPAGPGVSNLPIENVRDESFDIVTCFDVIEHEEEDTALLAELLRVARYTIFLSTPNWNTWHCQNKYHVREYTPEELEALLKSQEYVCWTAGANRATEPIRSCLPRDALANFCVAIRGPVCTDEQWLNFQSVASIAAEKVAPRLSRLGKWSEEWNTELKELFNATATPIEGLHKVTGWLNGLIRLTQDSLVAPERKEPVMDVLRYGAATRDEQFAVVAWAAKMIASCK